MVLVLVLILLSSLPLFNYALKKFLGYVFLVLINAGWIRVFLFKSGHKQKTCSFSPLECLLYLPCLTRLDATSTILLKLRYPVHVWLNYVMTRWFAQREHLHVLAVAWPQTIEKNVKVHLIDAFLGPVFVAPRSKGALCCAVPTILGIVMVIDMAKEFLSSHLPEQCNVN